MDEYSILRAGSSQRFAEVYGPTDEHDLPIADLWAENVSTDVYRKLDSDVRARCRCVDKRSRFADCVYSVDGLFVSERAAEVFKRFALPEGTVFLPVDVYTPKWKPLEKRLVEVMFPEITDAVDLKASKYKKLTEDTPWYFTEPPVVRASALRGLDLIKCFCVPPLCSGRLRREIVIQELTNFSFEKVRLC